MRLIDADKVIIPSEEYCARMAIQNAPTVDAVEVVRCKDCKHRDMTSKFECDFSAVFVFDDHFCSYGERREENE